MDRFSRIVANIVVADLPVAAPAPSPAEFDRALNEFLAYVNDMIVKYMQKSFPTLSPGSVSVMHGQRYVRLVKSDSDGGSRSAYGFVDKRNGDILMAAGWSAPAKHARGSIFRPETWKNAGPYGMAYLR